MYRNTSVISLILSTLIGTGASGQQTAQVHVSNVWARATSTGASTAAIYMTLLSSIDDHLISADTPVAATARVHEMHMDGSIMRMRELEGSLELPAGKQVVLGPGGYHLMLAHLTRSLKAGQSVAVHLIFEHSPPLDVTAHVEPIGASGPVAQAHVGGPGMNMQK